MGGIISTIFAIMESREDLALLSFDAFVFIVGLGTKITNSIGKVKTTMMLSYCNYIYLAFAVLDKQIPCP